MSANSGKAICEQSRSKKRYQQQDHLLVGLAEHPNSTSKELARELGFQRERYCDAPKRMVDLAQLGRIRKVQSRECRVTGHDAAEYVVADHDALAAARQRLADAGVVVKSRPGADSNAGGGRASTKAGAFIADMMAGLDKKGTPEA